MKKKESVEKQTYNDFVNFVIERWKSKSKQKLDEEKTRDYIDVMLYLMNGYRLKCLLGTIIDLSDLMEEWSGERCD